MPLLPIITLHYKIPQVTKNSLKNKVINREEIDLTAPEKNSKSDGENYQISVASISSRIWQLKMTSTIVTPSLTGEESASGMLPLLTSAVHKTLGILDLAGAFNITKGHPQSGMLSFLVTRTEKLSPSPLSRRNQYFCSSRFTLRSYDCGMHIQFSMAFYRRFLPRQII